MAPSTQPSLAHLVTPSSKGNQHQTQASRLLTPTTNPITLLSASPVKPISYAYTALIPLYYYLRSTSLIRDPITTLLYDLIPLGLTSAVFCVLCLPSAGNWNSGTRDGGKFIEGTAAGKIGKGSMRKKGAKVMPTGDKDGSGGSLQSRVMVTYNPSNTPFYTNTIPAHPLFHHSHTHPPTTASHCSCPLPRCTDLSILPTSSHLTSRLPCLYPRLFTRLLHPRRLQLSMARCVSCMATI